MQTTTAEKTETLKMVTVKVGDPVKVKILGYTVAYGSKKHAILVQTKKHLDDLNLHSQ